MSKTDEFRNPLRHIEVTPGTPLGDLVGLEKPKAPVKARNWRRRGFMVNPKEVLLDRNAKCHCGSGLKYKKCCLNKDEDSRFIKK
jgi:uncharacterized protein YecA (UPF0149 family)